VAVFLGRR